MKELRCPCGGIILADTEDFKEPLCPDCLFEFIRDYPTVKAVIDAAKYALPLVSGPNKYEALRKALDALERESEQCDLLPSV